MHYELIFHRWLEDAMYDGMYVADRARRETIFALLVLESLHLSGA